MTVTKIHRQHIPNDFENNELLNVVLQHLVSPPVIQTEGKIYYNSFKKIPFYSDGVEWIPFFGKPVQHRYSTQALMLAAQPIHNNGYIYYRSDQDIYYEYLGTTAGTMADYNAIGGSGLSSTYTHPVKTWVDKTALTGATVISNLTIDSLGHPTDWTTRSLTATDIGAEPVFTKGSLIQGGAVTLTGVISSRLFGTGDITIAHADTSTQLDVTTANGVIIRTLSFDTYGHVTGATTANLDDRWVRRQLLLDSTSTFLYTSETGSFPGVHVGHITTGSTGFPTVLGQFAAFGGHQTNSVSFFSRVFALFRSYDTENYYLGSANDNGSTNPWRLIYHSGNLNIGTLGGEPAFTKGSLIAGTNITLSGTISDRLVGSGDVTINAVVPAGSVPVTESFTYASTNVFTLSNTDVTAIYVTLNGQVLREGSIYDYTISGSTLTINEPLLIGGEVSIKYYTALANLTTVSRNIDGGAPDSVYLAIQNVDGGTP